MKRLIAAMFSGLLLAGAVHGQPMGTYDNKNYIDVDSPPFPMVDATNFVNENVFAVFTRTYYTFSDVVNFTNLNIMAATAYTFDTEPSSQGENHWADYFVNGNNVDTNLDNASITVDGINFIGGSGGGTGGSGGLGINGTGASVLNVFATNIINRGTLVANANGLINLTGYNVDVSRSVLALGTLTNRSPNEPDGIVDTNWGFGTNVWMNALANLSTTNPTTGNFMWTNIAELANPGQPLPFGLTNKDLSFAITNKPVQLWQESEVLITTNGLTQTNRTDQIVFVNNPNTNSLSVTVWYSGNTGYQLGTVIVQIATKPYTNLLGEVNSNSLYLVDTFGQNPTNGVITNYNIIEGIDLNLGPSVAPQIYTYEPDSFLISRSPPGALATATVGMPYLGHPFDTYPGLNAANFQFWGTNLMTMPTVISNWYAGYEVQLGDTTWPTSPAGSPNQTLQQEVRDLPGRVELHASGPLNMNLTRIQGLNYVLFGATNNFVGSTNAAVSAAFADIIVGSTNGNLTVSNLFQPLVPGFAGTISMYSGYWSNQFVLDAIPTNGTFAPTNFASAENEALFVDLRGLADTTASTVLDLNLKSVTTNGQAGQVIIGDNFGDIEGNFNVNAGTLIVQSNATIGLNPADLPNSSYYTQYWVDGVPFLDWFTNYGTVFGPNTMYFQDRATGPDGANLPYLGFVNASSGFISDEGTVVSADYFENRGVIFSGTGPTFINASNAVLIGVDVLPYNSTAYWANPALYQAFANIYSVESDISITTTNLTMTNQFLNPGRALDLNISGTLSAGTNFILVNDGINVGTKPATGDFNRVTVVDSATAYEDANNIWAGTDEGPVASGFTNNAALGRMVLDGGPHSAFTFSAAGPSSNALYVDVIEFRNNITNLDSAGNLINVSVQPGMKIYYGSAYSWINGVTPSPFTTNLLGKNGGVFEQVNHSGVIHTASEPATFSGAPPNTTYDFGLAVTESSAPVPTATISWNTITGANNYLYYENQLGGTWQLLTNFTSSVTGPVSVNDSPGDKTRFYQLVVSGP